MDNLITEHLRVSKSLLKAIKRTVNGESDFDYLSCLNILYDVIERLEEVNFNDFAKNIEDFIKNIFKVYNNVEKEFEQIFKAKENIETIDKIIADIDYLLYEENNNV